MKKRIISFLLTAAMLASCFTGAVFAEDKQIFNDVKGTEYYAQSAEALESLGILSGYEDGSFGAEKAITRAEMAAVICRMLGKETEAESAKGKTDFTDVPEIHWASGYINLASKAGIINGDGNGKFRPDDEVKYEEAVKMVVCALGLAKNIVADPSDWSKGYIEAAAAKNLLTNLKGAKGTAIVRGDIAVLVNGGLKESVSAPVSSLKAGEYTAAQKVKLTTSDADAEIYYTLDGTTPTANSAKYTAEITISKTSTLKAIAVKNGISSNILSVDYTIKEATASRRGGGGGGSSSGGNIQNPISDQLLNPDLNAPGEVTRQSWIKKLVETANLSMFNTSIESSFSDVTDDNYLSAIETALQNQVISLLESDPKFYPERYATTAFAAVTAVKALRFEYTNTQDCINFATQSGIFSNATVNSNLTQAQADSILAKVTEIINSTQVDPSAAVVSEVADDTVVLSSEELGGADFVYTPVANTMAENGSEVEAEITVSKTEATQALEAGECILLPATEEFPGGLAQKIVSVETNDNNIVLETSTPSLDEFMGDGRISAQGISEVDETKFVLNDELQDEVDVVHDDDVSLMGIEYGDKTTIILHHDSIELSFTKELADSVDANGSVELFFPDVEYNVDIDWNILGMPAKVNELYFALNNKVEAKGNIEVTGHKRDILNGVELGRLPSIPLGNSGFTVDIIFWAGLSATGKVELSYSLELTSGIQYKCGRLRTISSCDSNLDFTPLECDVKMGPNASAMLGLFGVFELADLTFGTGVGINASVKVRDTENICVDGTGYVYFDITALKNSFIGELLHLSGSWEIWKKDNSKFKKSLHFEGTPSYVGMVPSCTFGEGTLIGIVKDSESGEIITNYNVNCTKKSDGTGYNNSLIISPNGQFNIDHLPSGDYKIEISAGGYKTFEKTVNIRANQVEDLGNVLLISESAAIGTGSGRITDALTGNAISEATVEVYSDGETPIKTTTTDSNGYYSFELPAGHYTIYVSKADYSEGSREFVVTGAGLGNQDLTLIPIGVSEAIEGTYSEIGDLKIVLNWGEYPYDLDSHLCGPNKTGNDRFHIFYSSKEYSENGVLHSFLDHDDVDSYGPETTTVYNINTSGKYSFYIHDYTNRNSSSSTQMSNSGATVKVYVKEDTGNKTQSGETIYRAKMIGCFYVPVMTGGTLWHVFDYNAATGELIRKGTMTYQSEPDYVGNASLFSLDSSNEDNEANEDIQRIFSELNEK